MNQFNLSLEDRVLSQIKEKEGLGVWVTSDFRVLSKGNTEIGVYDLVGALTEFKCGNWFLDDTIEFFKTYDTHIKIENFIGSLGARIVAETKERLGRCIFGQQGEAVGFNTRAYYKDIKMWRPRSGSKYCFVVHPKGVAGVPMYGIKAEAKAELGRFAEGFLEEVIKVGGEMPTELALRVARDKNSYEYMLTK
jgi:hypothetical protein